MANISFAFERSETDAPHGFELGDLTVVIDPGLSVTSKGRTPDAGMMIYISMGDLMDGVASLLSGDRQYHFVGTDSSFSLHFKASKRGIEIRQGKIELGIFDPCALVSQVVADVDRFWSAHPLFEGDAVFNDVKYSREKLRKALIGPTRG